MHARRILNGQEAMRIERMGKFQKMKMEKLKIKKLIALADEQADIIAKNQKRKFKPNKDTVENAFKAIEWSLLHFLHLNDELIRWKSEWISYQAN